MKAKRLLRSIYHRVRNPRLALAVLVVLGMGIGGAPFLFLNRGGSTGGEEVSVTVSATRKARTFSDPGLLQDSITFKPRLDQGSMVGCVVTRIGKGSIFDEAGLKEGDLVRRVNHLTLDCLARALAMKDELARASEVTMDVVRGGRQEEVKFAFR